jgi:hypothetical protein
MPVWVVRRCWTYGRLCSGAVEPAGNHAASCTILRQAFGDFFWTCYNHLLHVSRGTWSAND